MDKLLNDMQQVAVRHTEGPLLILAGAGSGKTRVLTYRVAYLIKEKNIEPYNIMAITFTNKAADEMRNRVDSLVGHGADQVWVSTFHSACVRILRRYADRIGYANDFAIYDTDDQKKIMKKVIKHLNLNPKVFKEKGMIAKVSDFKNKLMTVSDARDMASTDFKMKDIARVYEEYQETLMRNNAMDFDDLIMNTVKLFKNNEDVLENYQNRLQYIHVDEYQDTNAAQFEFVRLLAEKHKNICVVGDDDQSIYKFRGADIQNILQFEKYFPGAKVVKLEQNYRSTKKILEAANSVIHNNVGRKDKTLWSDNADGAKIDLYQAEDGYAEAQMVADTIQEEVDFGRASYEDFAILYRTNAQSRALEEKLLMKNIPYKIIGGTNFYQRREIKDVLAYLRLLINPSDDLAVERIINVPRRGIGNTTVENAVNYARVRGMNLYDALLEADQITELKPAAVKKIKGFTEMIERLKNDMKIMSLEDLYKQVLDETGYVADLEAEETDEAEGRIENIDELLSKLVEYEGEAEDPTLGEFLEDVALIADIDNLEEDNDYVVLMTVHSAKGLEFPRVFLCGMEDGLFPGYMSIMSDDKEELEEERRLAYVAITRAQNELTISYAKRRMLRGETQYNIVSRFVEEIPPSIVNSKNVTDTIAAGYKRNIVRDTFAKAHAKMEKKPAVVKPKKDIAFGKEFTVTKADIDYKVGDRVEHIKFGEGTVKAIEDGTKDYQVTVDFDEVGQKMMMASFAKLKKL